MENKFSFSRLMMLANYDWVTNRKRYIIMLIEAVCAFTLINFVIIKSNSMHIVPAMQAWNIYIESVARLFALGCGMCFAISASSILMPLKTKESRIDYLMLPALNAEKFLWRLLVTTIFSWIGMFIAYIISDLIRIPMCMMLNMPSEFNNLALPYIFNVIVEENMTVLAWADSITSVLWFISLFILGGCVWYKHAFVKTFIIFMIGVVGIDYIVRHNPDIFPLINMPMHGNSIVSVIFSAIFIVANLVVSYRLFTKAKISERRLIRRR